LCSRNTVSHNILMSVGIGMNVIVPVEKKNLSWKETYNDTPWTRTKEGVVLPETSSEAIKRIYGSAPYAHLGGIRLTQCRCAFVTPDGNAFLPTTLQRLFGTVDRPIKALATYFSIPNGQVKNFLNACRGSVGASGHVRVAVVGSKASEGGGIWHKYYAIWLASRCDSVVIDFYDMSEVPMEWTVDYQGVQISCEWLAQRVDSDLLKSMNYNVVIDDVWTYETSSGLPGIDWVDSANISFSRKGTYNSDSSFVPFLHATESRKFSHSSPSRSYLSCRCMVCEVCRQCSFSYSTYLSLRMLCSRLGHRAYCVGLSWSHELEQLSSVYRALMTSTVIDVKENYMYRYLMSLSEEISLAVDGTVVSKVDKEGKDSPQFIPLSRFRETKSGVVSSDNFPWLIGKTVVFVGVPSSVLGSTRIKNSSVRASPEDCEVAFVSSVESWLQKTVAPVVYCPVIPATVAKSFPDWDHTGKMVRHFHEYVRRKDQKVIRADLKSDLPHVLEKQGVTPSSSLYPYCQGKQLSLAYKKVLVEGEVYTLRIDGLYVSLVPFEVVKWRKALIVTQCFWSPVRSNLEIFFGKTYEGLMNAATPLPWDVGEAELIRYESLLVGDAQDLLRQAYVRKTVMTKAFQDQQIKYRGKVSTMRSWLKVQVEFKIDNGYLVRDHFSHPVGMFRYEQTWQEDWKSSLDQGIAGFRYFLSLRSRAFSRDLGVT